MAMSKYKIGGRISNTLIEGIVAKYGNELDTIVAQTNIDERKLQNLLTLIKLKEYFLLHNYFSVRLRLAYPEYYE